ncbi:unnamed protein product, partial [Ectocarpus fasciculatus]
VTKKSGSAYPPAVLSCKVQVFYFFLLLLKKPPTFLLLLLLSSATTTPEALSDVDSLRIISRVDFDLDFDLDFEGFLTGSRTSSLAAAEESERSLASGALLPSVSLPPSSSPSRPRFALSNSCPAFSWSSSGGESRLCCCRPGDGGASSPPPSPSSS